MCESVILHLGRLVSFKCLATTQTLNTTLLTAGIYQFSTFRKVFESLESVSITISGKWKILKIQKVACSTTKVVQPCTLMVEAETGRLALYQLQDLNNFVAVFERISYECENISDTLFYLVDGPKLCCMNYVTGQATTIYQALNKSLVGHIQLPVIIFKPFLIKNNNRHNASGLTFLAVRSANSNAREAGVVPSKDANTWTKKEIACGCQWFTFEIVIKACNGSNCSIKLYQNKEIVCPPSSYCSITTIAVLVEGKRDEESSFLLATSYSQIILVHNGDVMKCCDLDLPLNCVGLDLIGSGDLSLILAVDHSKQTVLAIGQSSFEVLKIWTDVKCTTSGYLAYVDNVLNAFLLFHSCIGSNQILPDQYTALRGLEDVIVEMSIKSSESCHKTENEDADHNSEELEDLFSLSSPNVSGENPSNLEALSKVIKSLQIVRDKQAVEVDDLRRQLRHQDAVVQLTSDAIRSFNNNVYLCGSPKKLWEDEDTDLVDLFTGEPAPAAPESSLVPESYISLKKKWQKIVNDQWIMGFHLNVSDRSFCDFAVVLSSLGESTLPTNATLETQTSVFDCTMLPHADAADDSKRNVLSAEASSCSPVLSSGLRRFKRDSNNSSRVKYKDALDEILVVAATPVFEVSSANSAFYSCVVVSSRDHAGHKRVDDLHYFHVGRLSLSATAVASGEIVVKSTDLTAPSSADNIKECFAALMSYNVNKTSVVVSSEHNDVYSVCETVLSLLEFRYCRELHGHVCEGNGLLHLMFVRMHMHTRRRVTLDISCRSKREKSLLLRCINEQVPAGLIIEAILKDDLATKEKLDIQKLRQELTSDFPVKFQRTDPS